MTRSLSDLTDALLVAARRAGADTADALAVADRSVSISVRASALEQAKRAEGSELGLRVLLGRRQAYVTTSDLSDRTIATLAERAVAMAREAPEDPTAGLADSDQLATSWDLAALDLTDPGPEADAASLERTARRIEAAAMAHDGIAQVEASATTYVREVHLAASNGFRGGYAMTGTSSAGVAYTGTGTDMERDWAYETRSYAADMPDPEDIGTLAATRTLERKGAVRPRTGTYAVVYDERVAGSLIGHLMSAINGAAIARGSSWLRDAMGQPVLPPGLSVTEDPHRARLYSSRPFDGEGLPTMRRAFVRDGVLESWVLDLASGRKLGLASTGNAAREPGSPPRPSTTNIDLTQGTVSRADLLAQMGTGLLITSMIGSTISSTTGDYSRGAAGFWVEGGKIQYPVNECTVAGNLRDMLMRIVPADDARTHTSMRVPSLLVEGMMLAGA